MLWVPSIRRRCTHIWVLLGWVSYCCDYLKPYMKGKHTMIEVTFSFRRGCNNRLEFHSVNVVDKKWLVIRHVLAQPCVQDDSKRICDKMCIILGDVWRTVRSMVYIMSVSSGEVIFCICDLHVPDLKGSGSWQLVITESDPINHQMCLLQSLPCISDPPAICLRAPDVEREG